MLEISRFILEKTISTSKHYSSMSPLVSIIIPVFNQNEDYLHDCIESALNQTYKNTEIVLSDNHSTNNVSKVVAQFSDNRIKKVSPPTFLNMNDSFAFAASCANSEARYLSFLSSDDVMATNAIEALVEFAENNPSATFVAGNIIQSIEAPASFLQREDRIRTGGSKVGLYTFADALALFCPWRLSSTWMAGDLIRHDAYKATGGFAVCDYFISSDLWLTKELLKQRNSNFACIGSTTAFFRLRAHGVLPADGDRGLGVHLDMLRYCSEILLMATERDIGLKQRVSIYLTGIKSLAKVVVFTLLARKDKKSLQVFYKQPFQRYLEGQSTFLERRLIKWILSVKGLPLSLLTAIAQGFVNARKKAVTDVEMKNTADK
jgi:glycosyltransferase involved in cell wall biosynthesis